MPSLRMVSLVIEYDDPREALIVFDELSRKYGGWDVELLDNGVIRVSVPASGDPVDTDYAPLINTVKNVLKGIHKTASRRKKLLEEVERINHLKSLMEEIPSLW